jgi:hypothetical protein
MGFKVYLFDDDNNVGEADTEDIVIKSVFALLDINDLSTRKEKIQNIQFKGTKTNNQLFGNYFDLSRTSDLNNDTRLFFNYNPLKAVKCLVYEDSELVFRGSLRINQIAVDSGGDVIYDCVVTSSFIDLKTAIKDKTLSDLDLSDLQHKYNYNIIVDSWNDSTQRYNGVTYSTTAFQYGSGYVYPMIDYGAWSAITTEEYHVYNFRPAIYVQEYFDRIFNQDVLNGFSYEIKGSDEFKESFKHLVIPDVQEKFYSTIKVTSQNPSLYTDNSVLNFSYIGNQVVKFMTFTGHTANSFYDGLVYKDATFNRKLISNETFFTNFALTVHFTLADPDLELNVNFIITLEKRLKTAFDVDTYDVNNQWSIVIRKDAFYDEIGVYDVLMNGNNIQFEKEYEYRIGYYVFNTDSHLTNNSDNDTTPSVFQITNSTFTFPDSLSSTIRIEPTISTEPVIGSTGSTGSYIVPTPPVNIKQLDFIKSIINLFNLVVYTKVENEKHIIFETYDTFYELATANNLILNSLDWSNKIDYSKAFKIKSNLELPSKYSFSFKPDEDYFNKTYKDRNNLIYGEFSFSDELGIQELKKVELIFSPSVTINENLSIRLIPAFFEIDSNSNTKKLRKNNIRILYYNGLKLCEDFKYVNNKTPSTTLIANSTYYPQTINYDIGLTNLVEGDIHFGRPNEIFFNGDDSFINANTSYQYYINQVTSLTAADVVYVECEALLNVLDIANLNLKVPIYINTGSFNGAYFKVLKVEYENAETPSRLYLQKIAF